MARTFFFLMVAHALYFAPACVAQQNKLKLELFTRHVALSTPTALASIPAKVCDTMITQAQDIFAAANDQKLQDHLVFSNVATNDLTEASVNLRACATLKLNDVPRFDRMERDLAVGLYSDIISELDRRQRAAK